MAGNIQWFRWHHGSVNDSKFRLIARQTGTSIPAVLAVWLTLLEQASAADERGTFGRVDMLAIDCEFDFKDGTTHAIMTAMIARGLITEGRIEAWERRQPKRERDDDDSTERVQRHREKKRQEAQGNASGGNVTPSNASETKETPREEKSREEKNRKTTHTSSDSTATATPAHGVCVVLLEKGIRDASPDDPDLLALLAEGVAQSAFTAAAATAVANGRPILAYVLGIVKNKRGMAESAKESGKPSAAPVLWFESAAGITEKGAALGLNQAASEPFPLFKAKVFRAAETRAAGLIPASTDSWADWQKKVQNHEAVTA